MKNITETIGGRVTGSDIRDFLWSMSGLSEKDLPIIKVDGEEYKIKFSIADNSITLKKK